MKYLISGKSYTKENRARSKHDLESLPTKNIVLATAKRMLVRLFFEKHEEDIMMDLSNSESDDEEKLHSAGEADTRPITRPSLKEKLIGEIKKQREYTKTPPPSQEIVRGLTKEFDIFEATGVKITNIIRLKNALESIPPTSVEAERAFSAVGLFITKLRTRLSDRSVSRLSFLRTYYKQS